LQTYKSITKPFTRRSSDIIDQYNSTSYKFDQYRRFSSSTSKDHQTSNLDHQGRNYGHHQGRYAHQQHDYIHQGIVQRKDQSDRDYLTNIKRTNQDGQSERTKSLSPGANYG